MLPWQRSFKNNLTSFRESCHLSSMPLQVNGKAIWLHSWGCMMEESNLGNEGESFLKFGFPKNYLNVVTVLIFRNILEYWYFWGPVALNFLKSNFFMYASNIYSLFLLMVHSIQCCKCCPRRYFTQSTRKSNEIYFWLNELYKYILW